MGTHGLRPLGLPRRLIVAIDAYGLPTVITRDQKKVAVSHIEEIWRVAEAWWREHSMARTYVRVLLEEGHILTCFHDDACPPEAGWYEQRY